jgi:hypothetical protein
LNPDGTLKWRHLIGTRVRSSPAVTADGTVYVGSDDGNLNALDSAGDPRWAFPTGAYVYSSPLIGTNGTIFIGSADSTVYAVQGNTGLADSVWPMFHGDVRHTGQARSATSPVTNLPPAISLITDQTVDEGAVFTYSAIATDPDQPGQSLQFSLLSGPAGATIGVSSGLVSWPTTETDGPGTNVFSVTVADNGSPSLMATQTFLVDVREINSMPALNTVSNQTISPGAALNIQFQAQDGDVPTNALTYRLLVAPTAAQIDPVTGGFSWTPSTDLANTSHPITVEVSDSGLPMLSNQTSLTVFVTGPTDVPPTILSFREQSGTLILVWTSVAGRTYWIQSSPEMGVGGWVDLPGDIVANAALATNETVLGPDPQRFYRVRLLP